MITVVHGGQTGVDRGTHEAAIDNGWNIVGYMPRDQRDELGKIPETVARFLVALDQTSYAARTEANVHTATTALFVVRDVNDPRETPGTAMTLELITERRLRHLIVDLTSTPETIARWIWTDMRLMTRTLELPFLGQPLNPVPTRLLVAGPRESKWPGACVQTAALLRRVAVALTEIVRPREPVTTAHAEPPPKPRASLRPGDEVMYTKFTLGGSYEAKAIVTWDHGKRVEARTLPAGEKISLERAADGSLSRFT